VLERVKTAAPAAARWAAALGQALLVVACGGDSGTPPPLGTEAAELVKASGDQQTWFFENTLPEPYRIVALDAEGQVVPDVVVSWAVTSGGGSVDPTQSVTDASGIASTTHTLGQGATSQTVTASAAGVQAVTFTATGTSPPTTAAVAVGNNVFSPRDALVEVGGTVTWTWSAGADVHNVTYTAGPSPRPPDSSTQDSGSHESQFAAVGRYEYACTIHAGMEGTVTVVR
jgi:plastocyanin